MNTSGNMQDTITTSQAKTEFTITVVFYSKSFPFLLEIYLETILTLSNIVTNELRRNKTLIVIYFIQHTNAEREVLFV